MRGKGQGARGKVFVAICVLAVNLAGLSYARTNIESLAQVEKLFMEGRYERVVQEATILIDARASGREELFYLKGLSQAQLTKYSQARETFEYMIERYPRGKRAFDGYIGIGDSYFMEGKFADALTEYSEAIKNYPDHKNESAAYYKIGNAYQKLGNAEKAKEYFDKVRDRSPLSFESNMIPKDLGASKPEIITKEPPKESAQIPDAGNSYYVQAGYFKSKANAQKLTDKLKEKGYDCYMSTQIRAGLAFYRVKVGHFRTRSEAETMSRKLKADGYKTKVCL